MFDAAMLKLLAAMLLFVIPVHLLGDVLPKREIAGRRLSRGQAQVVGAVVGLALGIGFLLAVE
jgi:hypothetical protein